MRKFIKLFSALLIIALIFNMTGCKKQDKAQKKPQTSQKTEIPKELTKIEKDIEKIISEAKKIKEKPSSTSSKKDSDKDKKKETSTNEKSWKEIEKTVKDIHSNWNSLNPIVTKKGAKLNLINSMSAAINDLTLVANKKSKIDVLIYANGVYKYIPELEGLFSTDPSLDIKKLKFYGQDIDFKSEIQKWDEISKDLIDISSTWQTLKTKLPKEAKTSADKFNASISELQKAVKSQNKVLTKVKAEVFLNNLKSLEKAAKPKK